MSKILTITSKGMCPHGGLASLASLSPATKCQISGMAALTEASVGPVSFACPALTPCVTITSWIVRHTCLTEDGVRLLTDQSIPVTNNGPGRIIDPGQKIVELKE